MKTTEKILVALFTLSFAGVLLRLPVSSALLIISVSTLACLYYPLGAFLFNGIRLRHITRSSSYAGLPTSRLVAGAVCGFILGIVLLGVLFGLKFWPGHYLILTVGVLLSGGALVLLVIMSHNDASLRPFATSAGKRLVLWSIPAVLLWLTPQMRHIEWRYADRPALVEAWRAHLAAPENHELKTALDSLYRYPNVQPNGNPDNDEHDH